MKNTKLLIGLGFLTIVGIVLVAADHIDAPGTTGNTADISDFYGFESPSNSDNTVFIIDLQTNVLPDLAYGEFDENVLTEINIDTDNDLIEDLVIQALPRGDTMYFFGPTAPDMTGRESEVLTDFPLGQVAISDADALTTTTEAGVSLFAGPRQDPFFFDFGQFNKVIGGNAPEGFLPEGEAVDTFDGANTMSLVVEIPNSMLGETTATNVLGLSVYKTWVTTNRKQ
ncbi:DUF4331 family protein [Pareuzebyella sediminis]|uniref:DUF4331 family protein n=1 Tax=Pareuzebyella sediminis TaxID=2607998 RepID=UPI0011F00102|nr:DUF4331 family protein [Pareuzebyella sediminis]